MTENLIKVFFLVVMFGVLFLQSLFANAAPETGEQASQLSGASPLHPIEQVDTPIHTKL